MNDGIPLMLYRASSKLRRNLPLPESEGIQEGAGGSQFRVYFKVSEEKAKEIKELTINNMRNGIFGENLIIFE